MTAERKVNILLVDDEPKNLLALEAVLASDDRTLVRAASGEEALRWLLKDSFAVVLLDVHMPGLDGFETAALIRGREKTRDVPIIFLTAANRGDAHVAEGYSLGAVDYILKPFDPEILRSKVAVFVELARKSEQIERQAQQLAEATAFLTNILESSTEYSIIAQDLEGQVLAWNEGARRIYGYTAEEMIGRQNAKILHTPEDVSSGKVEAALLVALRTGKLEGEFERVREDGRRFTGQLAITVRRDAAGQPIGYLVVSKDVTQQKLEELRTQLLIREQAARVEAEAARQRFAFLADASSVVASSLDSERTLQSVAEFAVPTLADSCIIDLREEDGHIRRVATASADRVGEGGNGIAAVSDAAVSELSHVLRTGMSVLRSDVPPSPSAGSSNDAGHLDGEATATSSEMIIPLMAHGRTLGAMSLKRRQRYDDDELALAEDLARRVALAVDNARLYREAQEAVRIRGEFASMASHDLKTPLTVIKGQAKLLQRRAGRIDAPDAKRIVDGLETIDQTTTKMAGIIDELLDVAQLEMGRRLELSPQPTDLAGLTRGVAAALAHDELHPIRVEATLPDLVGPWDPVRLERVVDNLLANAIKYSPGGGEIVVSLGREEGPLGEEAVLRVSDSGVGIPSDELPRVFERFFRARNVVGRIAGTGIGLAGVRQIVEEHGGTVALTSEEGVGTTVVVRLPRSEPRPRQSARSASLA